MVDMKKQKIKTLFRCQQCEYTSPKWMGRCPDCGQWNTFVEEKEAPSLRGVAARPQLTDFSSAVMPLHEVSIDAFKRRATGIAEFDRMLGGGVVPCSLILLGGPPGIGKSTLMLQVSAALAAAMPGKDNEAGVLYVSGEESLSQVKSRADRLNIKGRGLYLVSETNLENILENINKVAPAVVVIDSIQTTYRQDLAGAPGSVGQVRECTAEFLRLAETKRNTIFLLRHVTQAGD